MAETDILMVCTGNICRSPMAEAFLRQHLLDRGLNASVHSAGLFEGGAPASELAVAELAGRRIDLGPHRSRRLARELIAGADLVVGMAREHVREAVVLDPASWSRAFTLKELVRRGEAAGAVGADEDLPAWLARLGAGRSRRDLLGRSAADDVADPMGQAAAVYRACATELDDLCRRLAILLAGPNSEAVDGK